MSGCPERAKPGGCQLHNLQCNYPDCDAAPILRTRVPASERIDEDEAQLVIAIREIQRMHQEQLKPYVDALIRYRSLRPLPPFFMRVGP